MSTPNEVEVAGRLISRPPGKSPTVSVDLSHEITAYEGASGSILLEKGGTAGKHKINIANVSSPVLLHMRCSGATFTVDLPHGGSTALNVDNQLLTGLDTTLTMTSIGVSMVSDSTAIKLDYFIAAVTS